MELVMRAKERLEDTRDMEHMEAYRLAEKG